jgi:hypothetical protein
MSNKFLSTVRAINPVLALEGDKGCADCFPRLVISPGLLTEPGLYKIVF